MRAWRGREGRGSSRSDVGGGRDKGVGPKV